MKIFWEKFKGIVAIVFTIILLAIIIVPYIIIYINLKKRDKNEVLEIYPEVRIKKIKNKGEVDKNALESGVRIGKEILKKLENRKKNKKGDKRK